MNVLGPELLAFTVVAALLTVAPGPDTFLVIRNSLRGGRPDGFLTALGISSGLWFHALLSAIGVSAVLAHSAAGFLVLKAGGALYLAWLGLQSLRSAFASPDQSPADTVPPARVEGSRSYREGLLTNLLNPKVIVFYLALLPQFISPGDAVIAKSLLLAAIHGMLGIAWFAFVSWGVDRSRQLFLRPRLRRFLDGLCGLVLVGFGLRLALAQR